MGPTYQPDLFAASLPAWLACSDEPDTYGTAHAPRCIALSRAYIDPNCKALLWALVFDIDRPGAAMAWDDANMPRPNWITQNPRSGHAHLGYALGTPVARSELARGAPLRFLARIQAGMTLALDADRSYTHRLTKTPDHPQHRTFWEAPEPYDLRYLRDFLGERLPLRIPRADAVGEGRNVTLFDGLRRWAYRARLAYGNLDAWHRACRAYAEGLNDFACPLGVREVNQVAKSVAAWTWINIDAAGFSEVQRARQRRQAISRQAPIIDNHALVLNL